MEKYRKIIQNVGGPAYMAYINAFQVRFPRQKKTMQCIMPALVVVNNE